jgi:cytidylate kinase
VTQKQTFFQIAMDGPAGSGKSTIAKNVAKKLNFTYLNSGGLYRCYAIALRDSAIDVTDVKAVIKVIEHANVDQKGTRLYLNDLEVNDRAYTKDISSFVPVISKIPEVRLAVGQCQYKIADHNDIVVEGRDTTTEVFPNATLKIYVQADPKLRAQRR